MTERVELFEDYALGRPYHAALVDLKGRSLPHGHRDYYEVMAVVGGAGEHLVFTSAGGTQPLPPHTTVDDDRAAQACAQVLERFHRMPGELDLIRFWTEIVPLFASLTGGSGQPSGVPDWLTTATAA